MVKALGVILQKLKGRFSDSFDEVATIDPTTFAALILGTAAKILTGEIYMNEVMLGEKRDRRDPPLRCDCDTILGRPFISTGLFIQKLLYITLFELKLSMSFQIRRLLYWLDLAPIYKRVKRGAANLQSAQDFLRTEQFIVTHKIPFCARWTRRTILTSHLYKVYNTDIVHDKIKFDKVQKKSTDRSQCPKFLPMFRLLRLDWYPVAIALDQYALLLLYMTDKHISSQSMQEPRRGREARP